jgi:hypothetical protein
MLVENENPLSVITASMSNTTMQTKQSSAEARVRKLEHRMTGGKPPLSPYKQCTSRLSDSQPLASLDLTSGSNAFSQRKVARCEIADVSMCYADQYLNLSSCRAQHHPLGALSIHGTKTLAT